MLSKTVNIASTRWVDKVNTGSDREQFEIHTWHVVLPFDDIYVIRQNTMQNCSNVHIHTDTLLIIRNVRVRNK